MTKKKPLNSNIYIYVDIILKEIINNIKSTIFSEYITNYETNLKLYLFIWPFIIIPFSEINIDCNVESFSLTQTFVNNLSTFTNLKKL